MKFLRLAYSQLLFVFLCHSIIFGSPECVPGKMILKLKFESGFTSNAIINDADEFHKKMKAQSINRLSISSKPSGFTSNSISETLYMVDFSDQTNIEKTAKDYQSQFWVEYAEPCYYVTPHQLPNDEKINQQTYLISTDLFPISELKTTHQITIAVIDSGIDYTHPDIAAAMYQNPNELPDGIDNDMNGYIDDIYGYNFVNYFDGKALSDPMDQFGHGSHIAGIIAAKKNNEIGVAGICQNSKIMALKFMNSAGKGTQIDAAYAIRYAVDAGASIINCSWGFNKYNQILKDAIDYALKNKVTIVASIGNMGTILPVYPAYFPGVFAIGSVNLDKNKSSFSNFGSRLDFVTYGEKIISIKPNNQYETKSGTSQAAAVMTGILSQLLSIQPSLTKDELYYIIKKTSTNENKSTYMGYGLIQKEKLFALLNQPLPDTVPIEPQPEIQTPKKSNTKKAQSDPLTLFLDGLSQLFNLLFGWL